MPLLCTANYYAYIGPPSYNEKKEGTSSDGLRLYSIIMQSIFLESASSAKNMYL